MQVDIIEVISDALYSDSEVVIDAAGIIDSLSHVKGFRSDRAITCGGEMDLNPLTIYLELSSSSLYLTRT